jgi:hypothetical protein
MWVFTRNVRGKGKRKGNVAQARNTRKEKWLLAGCWEMLVREYGKRERKGACQMSESVSKRGRSTTASRKERVMSWR